MPVLTARGCSSGGAVARSAALPAGSLAEAVLVSLDSPSHAQAEPELAIVLQSLRSKQEAEACSVSTAAASASTAIEERRAYHRHSAGEASSRAPADQQEGHRILQYVSRRALRRRAPILSQHIKADNASSFWQQKLKPGNRQHPAAASAAAALLYASQRTDWQPVITAPDRSLPEASSSLTSAERGTFGSSPPEASRQQHLEAFSSRSWREAGLMATSHRAREAQAVMRRALASASSLAEAGPDVASDKCDRPS